MQAIETRYAGHHFRSRLEARWAVFFDFLSIPWEYEAEGFHTTKGKYLPDFRIRIPQVKDHGYYQWFEVKPPAAPEDARHAALAAETGAPLIVARGMPRSYPDQIRGHASPLMIHGVEDTVWPVAFADTTEGERRPNDSAFYCALGENRHWCQEHFSVSLSDETCHLAIYGRHQDSQGEWVTRPPYEATRIDAAYAAALSARF